MAMTPSPEQQTSDEGPQQKTIFGEANITLGPMTSGATASVTDFVVPPGPAVEPPGEAAGAPEANKQVKKRTRTQVTAGVTSRFGNAGKPKPGISSPPSGVSGAREPPSETLSAADADPISAEATPSASTVVEELQPGADSLGQWWQNSKSQNRDENDESLVLQEARRRMAETVLASPKNDNPLSADSVDLLDVADDAKAFARLAASKDVKPPLAVAIFGSWGSGKSFFMRLVQEHVQRLSDGKPDDKAPEATSDSFHRGIAQIRFNAWHYSETNLWASLVDHLFTQLGTYVSTDEARVGAGSSVLDNLSTARTLTIESAERLETQRKTQAALTGKLAQAEAERKMLERKVLTRPSTYLHIIESVIASRDPSTGGRGAAETELMGAIEEAVRHLGVDNLAAEAEKVADQLRTADSLAGEARIIFDAVAVKLKGKLWAALMFACIPAAVILLWLTFGALQLVNVSEVSALIAKVVGSLAIVGGAIGALTRFAGPVLAKMKAVKKAVDQKLAEGLAEHEEGLAANREALRKAEAMVVAAKQDLNASAARLVSAVEDFHGSTGTGRLLRFLRTRAKDGHYAQHLGLVASVRRDFEELSLGMQGEGTRIEMPAEELESLRARLGALTAAGSALLPEDREALEDLVVRLDAVSNGAHSLKPPFSRLVLYVDDLDRCSHEKVMDVLQAVHMLTAFPLFMVFLAVDVRWLSQALLSQYGDMLALPGGAKDQSRAGPHDYLEKIFQLPYWIEEVNETTGAKLLESLLPVEDDEETEGRFVTPGQSGVRETAQSEAPLAVRSLKFKRFHRNLVGLLSPFFVSSPRKLLWFVNAFRVLKATSSPLSEAQEVETDFAIILQLALVSISPEEFRRWLIALRGFEEALPLSTMLDSLPKTQYSVAFWGAAREAAKHAQALEIEFHPVVLRQCGQRAQRFCFNAPQPFNALTDAPTSAAVEEAESVY